MRQTLNVKKGLLALSILAALTVLAYSCKKNVSKDGAISLQTKTSDVTLPHFVPARAPKFADLFLLDGSAAINVDLEQSSNGMVRRLERIITTGSNGVYRYILVEMSETDLNSRSKFTTIIADRVIDKVSLFSIDIDTKYHFLKYNHSKFAWGKSVISVDEERDGGTLTAHYKEGIYSGDEQLKINPPYGASFCIDWYWTTYEGNSIINEEYLFTTCGGGSEAGSGEVAGPNLNHLCGGYNWKTIGSALYAQVNGLGMTFVAGGGATFSVTYGIGCVSLPKSTVNNSTANANKAFNDAWAYAMNRNTYDINNGGPLGDFFITQHTTAYIKTYLQANYPGATFNKDGCSGSIPATVAQYC